MKVLNHILSSALIFMFIVSCGSSIQSDAKKVAKLQCEAQKLSRGLEASSIEESQELLQEANKLMQKLKKKYKSTEEIQELQAAVSKAMGNCN